MKKLLLLAIMLCQAVLAQGQTVYRLDANDVAQSNFWTTDNLTNLLTPLSASSLTINPLRVGIPTMVGQSGKALSNNGSTMSWVSFQPLNSELTTIGTNGSAFYLSRSNHTGSQTLSTISDAGGLAALSAVASAQITNGSIVNEDISASAAIVVSKISGLGAAALLATTPGGLGEDDAGLVPVFGGQGQLVAAQVIAQNHTDTDQQAALDYNGFTFLNHGNSGFDFIIIGDTLTATRTLTLPNKTGIFALISDLPTLNSLLPSQTGNSGKVLTTDGTDTSWVATSSGLTIGSTSITGGTVSRLLVSGTAVGELTPGTGVFAALSNATDAASGLLTYGIIGTSGAKLPLLNAANTFSEAITFNKGTASSSTSTGTVIVSGGVGISGRATIGTVYGTGVDQIGDGILLVHNTLPTNTPGTGVQIWNNWCLHWRTTNSVGLWGDVADTLRLESGTRPQFIRIYGTTTGAKYLQATHDGTNAVISASSGAVMITTGGLTVGASGSNIATILRASATKDFDLTTDIVEDQTMTCVGAVSGDDVVLGVPNGSVTTTAQFTAWVSADDTIKIRCRTAIAGENPSSGTFSVTVFKR